MELSPTGCWLYGGKTDRYGHVYVRGKIMVAHRVAYELVKGEIPEGMLVCHKCDVPGCCNPDHLWIGTDKDNMQDMVRKGRGITRRNRAKTDYKGVALPTDLVNEMRVAALFRDMPARALIEQILREWLSGGQED